MAGALNHSPADIIRHLLILAGFGSSPSGLNNWPIFVSNLPDLPDNVITIYDTQGDTGLRSFSSLIRDERYGISVQVRATDHKTGFLKAHAIAIAFDNNLGCEGITIDGTLYSIVTIIRKTNVIALGNEIPTSKRQMFSLNALVDVGICV